MDRDDVKIMLTNDEMPRRWYNIVSDLPESCPPPLNPQTNEPIGPKDLAPIFPMGLIKQEVSTERYTDIPEEITEAYIRLGRPTPLYRARRLERYLKTPAKIYFKREDVSFVGSHKVNTAIPQAYYNMKEGVEQLITETGAGQWGSALSLATQMFGLKCQVFMVKVSYEQKPYRKYVMKLYGAQIYPSPSKETKYGQRVLEKDPNCAGSLGIAISEAIEVAVGDDASKYSLGSVLNHVMLHQSIIGQEVRAQLDKVDATPDIMVGCVGGGSNYAGFAFPFIGEQLRKGKTNTEFVAVEPTACPTLTGSETGESKYDYDFGDTAGLTPMLKMYTLGHEFIPPPIHAGGLRYHGMAPTVSLLYKHNIIRAEAYNQQRAFEAARIFIKTEGIIPAPETSHAIVSVIEHAARCKESGDGKTIVFNFSGHGLLDLQSYADVLSL
ncbi:MAG: TrpB-like pyridoxal phosphate-dependent enzyme [Candidatus Micrarchaeota archaeon]